jgi:sulfur-carrier protein
MNITVHYFGLLAERRGLAEERIETTARTAAELYAMLDADHKFGLAVSDFRVAINDEFVGWDHPLQENDSVALLPPMSGG